MCKNESIKNITGVKSINMGYIHELVSKLLEGKSVCFYGNSEHHEKSAYLLLSLYGATSEVNNVCFLTDLGASKKHVLKDRLNKHKPTVITMYGKTDCKKDIEDLYSEIEKSDLDLTNLTVIKIIKRVDGSVDCQAD